MAKNNGCASNEINLYGTSSENGKKLNLQNISENHAGRYTCTADNGVGNPVSEDITLKVLCKIFYFKFSSKQDLNSQDAICLKFRCQEINLNTYSTSKHFQIHPKRAQKGL